MYQLVQLNDQTAGRKTEKAGLDKHSDESMPAVLSGARIRQKSACHRS